MADVDAVGGWIRDADSTLPRTYRNLINIPGDQLDTSRLAYFNDYRTRYFNDQFFPAQGTEEIFEALATTTTDCQRWLDIGAGVTSLFWSIGLDYIDSVDVCDLVPEALQILHDFVKNKETPPCYRKMLSILGKDDEYLCRIRELPWQFHVFDALQAPWPDVMKEKRYDIVSAIGCLGLSSGPDGYSVAFDEAVEHLSPAGRIVGADWIRSDLFITQEGHDNRYLGLPLSRKCAIKRNLIMLYENDVKIVGDPYYNTISIWGYARG